MSGDLRTLLREATGDPLRNVDVELVRRRARMLRARRRVGRATAATVLAVVTSFGIVMTTRGVTSSDRAGGHAKAGPSSGVYHDPAKRLSFVLPHGWYRAQRTLAPYVLDPHELFAAATFPIPERDAGAGCDAQLPRAPLDAMTRSDVFVWVVEWDTSGRFRYPEGGAPARSTFRPRPADFGRQPFSSFDCTGPTWTFPQATFVRTSFEDHGRLITVNVALGRTAPQERVNEMTQLLNSLHLDGLSTLSTFQLPVPSGWHRVNGDLFASSLAGQDEAAVATFAFSARIDRACDIPVSALDALGPTDGLIAAHVIANGTGYSRRPPLARFLPSKQPASAYAKCLHRQADFDLAVNGFIAERTTVEVFTALGKHASSQTKAALLDVLRGLQTR